MTARLVFDTNRKFRPMTAIDDYEFDADEWTLSSRGNHPLWQRVAEGKQNADLAYPFYKRRHLLGPRND